MRAGGEEADRDSPRPCSGLRSPFQPTASATFSTSPTRSASSGLPPGAKLLARRAEVLAAHVERVETGAARELVHLQLADPLEVGRAEGAVRAGGRGVRVHAGSVDAIRLPAVRARRGVAGGRGHPRAVVRVRARVEPAVDLPSQQPPLGAHRRSHPALHSVAARRHHRLRDAVLDPHRPAGLPRERDGDRLHLRVRLRAEAAAQVRDDDADVRDRHLEERGDLGADEERVLAGRPQRDLVRPRPGRRPCASPSRTGRRPGTCTRPRRRAPRGRRPLRSRRGRCGSGSRRFPPPASARRGRGRGPGAAGRR